MVKFSIRIFCFALLLSALVFACQKDENVKVTDTLKTDSTKKVDPSVPGNYLANKGTLQVKMHDSTYTFDAAKDSIAFVNIDIDGEKYFGLTAINKAHTVSFGISSVGSPVTDTIGNVSGCQFLLHAIGKANQEYTLTHTTPQLEYGTIALEKYNQDTVLAKGTFHTYLANDAKANSLYITEGSFELKLK